MPNAAAINARISSDQAGTALGVRRQLEDCRAEAERRGWTVAEEYVDNDVSAYSGKRRLAYEQMLADIADGQRDAVIVYHLDRLHRRPKELEEFVEVCDRARLKHVATLAGDVNFGSGDGLLVARIMGAVAAQESDAKSRRVRRKMLENAQLGRPNGGARAFGYEPDGMVVREGRGQDHPRPRRPPAGRRKPRLADRLAQRHRRPHRDRQESALAHRHPCG